MSDKVKTIEERARHWVWSHADHECGGLEAGICYDCDRDTTLLAEQFREVERAALATVPLMVQQSTQGPPDELAFRLGNKWQDTMDELILTETKLAEVLKAADALREAADGLARIWSPGLGMTTVGDVLMRAHSFTVRTFVAAYDAATKGIER